MSMKYIRDYYKVPAKRGGRIRYTDEHGDKWDGRITAASDQYLLVHIPGWHLQRARLHPTWNVEYLDNEKAET
jgi:hypothetical protein